MRLSWRETLSLTWVLAARDLRQRYRGSIFPGWSLLLPLIGGAASAGIAGAVFRVRFFAADGAQGIWLPVLCGVLPWLQVQEAVRRGVSSIADNRPLARNARVPLALFPLHLVAVSLVLEMALLILAAPWLFPRAGLAGFLGVAAVLPLQVVFSAGLVLVLAPLQVYIRDLAPAVVLFLPAWFYASPILYGWERVPSWMHRLYAANPLAPLAAIYRDLLWEGRLPRAADAGILAAWALAFGITGWVVFRRLQARLVDEL